MKKYVSENARNIISTICDEHALQAERVAGGWIEPDQVIPCIIERLNARSQKDENLRAFLSSMAVVPLHEDESPDMPWAEDKRPPNMHEVRHGPQNPDVNHERGDDWIESRDFPMPGERVC